MVRQMKSEDTSPQESLDPDDWQALRRLAHQMIDDSFDFIETVEQRPVWQSMPQSVLDFLKQPAPKTPSSPEQIYQDFKHYIQPYPMGNIHPCT